MMPCVPHYAILQDSFTTLKYSVPCLFLPQLLTPMDLFPVPALLPFPGCPRAGITQDVYSSSSTVSRRRGHAACPGRWRRPLPGGLCTSCLSCFGGDLSWLLAVAHKRHAHPVEWDPRATSPCHPSWGPCLVCHLHDLIPSWRRRPEADVTSSGCRKSSHRAVAPSWFGVCPARDPSSLLSSLLEAMAQLTEDFPPFELGPSCTGRPSARSWGFFCCPRPFILGAS